MKAPKTPPAPPAPDPRATAQAQASGNLATATGSQILNMTDQFTPDGSLTYKQLDGVSMPDGFGGTNTVPRFSATQTLSPQQQQLHDIGGETELSMATTARDQAGRIGELLGSPMGLSGVPMPRGLSGAGGDLRYPGQPDGQQRFLGDTSNQMLTIADVGSPALQFGDAGAIDRVVGADNFSDDRRRVEEALMSRMNPQLANDRAALEGKLINAGHVRGSEGFNRAMDESGRQATDARFGAILAGGQEQSRLTGLEFGKFDRENAAQQQFYNQQLGRGQFYNAGQQQAFGQAQARTDTWNAGQREAFGQDLARNQFYNSGQATDYSQGMQAIGMHNQVAGQEFGQDLAGANYEGANRDRILRELFAVRNQPINEISALMSGSQVSQPNFTGTPQTQVGGVDYSGLVSNNYNQQMAYATSANAQKAQQQNSMMGGLFGLGGNLAYGAMRFSDRRLKTDVRAIGTGSHGLPLYSFRYLWGEPSIGFMADEVARVRPDAVVTTPSGFLAVDYSRLEGAR